MADAKALAELVRQGERVLDHQVQQSDTQDEKSRQVLALVAGLLAAAAAGSGFLAGVPEVDAGWLLAPLVVLVTAMLACAARAFHLAASAYLGRPGEDKLVVGWGAKPLRQAGEEGDALADVHLSTLAGMESWIQANLASQTRSKALRLRSYWWLFAAGACLVAASMYAAVVAWA